MALPRTVDSLDTVDEKYHEVYTETEDGKFVLDIEGVDNVEHLRNAYERVKEDKKKLQERAKAAESKLKNFDGVDPDEYAQLLSLKDEVERKTMESKGEYEQILKSTEEKYTNTLKKERERYQNELKAAQEKQETLMGQLRQVQLVEKSKSAMLRAGVIQEDVDDVWTLTERYFSLGEDGSPVVLDEDGDPTALTVDEFYANVFKERKPKFYGSERKGGGGSPTGKGETTGSKPGSMKLTREQLQAGQFDLDLLAAGKYEMV